MKSIAVSLALIFAGSAALAGQVGAPLSASSALDRLSKITGNNLIIQASVTCFSKGEQTSGMNKICYYDCLGSAAAITISAVSLCPLTIKN